MRPSLLYCMRPVREGDTIDVWKEYENDCQEVSHVWLLRPPPAAQLYLAKRMTTAAPLHSKLYSTYCSCTCCAEQHLICTEFGMVS